MAAATSAMKKAGLVMVQGYMHECLEKSAKEAGSKQNEPLKDFYLPGHFPVHELELNSRPEP